MTVYNRESYVKPIAKRLTDSRVRVDKMYNHKISASVPQGSVLGLTLWNLIYDGVLRENIPECGLLIAYIVNQAVVVVGSTLDNQ